MPRNAQWNHRDLRNEGIAECSVDSVLVAGQAFVIQAVFWLPGCFRP